MHVTIDYSKSPAAKHDAMQDVMEWFGSRWETVNAIMKEVKDVRSFTFAANFAGVRGFPVSAWYDHYWGEGAYDALPE